MGLVQAVRMGDWKLLQPAPGKPFELYDLRTDIGESKDVADRNPEVVAKIKRYLATARTEPRKFPAEKSPGVNDFVK